MSERNLQAAAHLHALTAAHLQGAAIAQRAMRYAALLKWGRPARVSEDRGAVVLTFSAGRIVGQIGSGQVVIYPTS